MGTLFIKILRIFVVLVVLFSGAMGYVISEKTLAAWWIPVGVALAAGMLTLPLYRKSRKGKPKVLSLIRGGFGLPVIKKGI